MAGSNTAAALPRAARAGSVVSPESKALCHRLDRRRLGPVPGPEGGLMHIRPPKCVYGDVMGRRTAGGRVLSSEGGAA